VSEFALYDIIKMRDYMCLNYLYKLVLKWELDSVLMRFLCYYNEGWYVSECALCDIIKMRACMCLNAL